MQKLINITKGFKFAIIIPIVVMITGILFNIFVGADLAIEFRGGTAVTYSYSGKINFDKVKKSTENALKEVNSETVLTYNYTGTLDESSIVSNLNSDEYNGFEFSAQTGSSKDSTFIEISAIGSKFLSEDEIKAITSTLSKSYVSNSLTLKGKLENSFKDVKVEVKSSTALSTGEESIKINAIGNIALTTSQIEKITTTLTEDFSKNEINEVQVNSVSESFGSSFFGKAIFAVILASILVILYVGYRFRKVGGVKAGITALAALIHDVFFIYFFNVIFGITIDTNFIAVFLTILGYSLNDTIVIYDRIRENAGIYGNKMSIRDLTNLSVTQSFKRTCVTSITTFCAIMSVTVVALVYNLDTILSFAIPMSVGTICGTFSSLFMAGPLYVFWCEHDEKKGGKAKKEGKQKSKKSTDYTNKIKGKGKKVQY